MQPKDSQTTIFKKEWIKTFGKFHGFVVRALGRKCSSGAYGTYYAFMGKLYVFPAKVFYGEKQHVKF